MEKVTCKLMGGLGNYLFQIAAAYSLSLRDNKIFLCDSSDVYKVHKPYTSYINNILRNVNFTYGVPDCKIHEEPSFNYSEVPFYRGNVKLIGYFQSEKYFLENKQEILSLFKMDENTSTYLQKKYGNILNTDTCSIHIRRGDYLNKQNYHPVQEIDYYYKSLNKVGYDKHFLIFSDDINWCKENFDFIPNKTFISDNEDYQDIYLMSMCKNNIIANSSFSWWGAWLNQNVDKKVIAPSKWFGVSNLHLNTNDLYCDKWIKI